MAVVKARKEREITCFSVAVITADTIIMAFCGRIQVHHHDTLFEDKIVMVMTSIVFRVKAIFLDSRH